MSGKNRTRGVGRPLEFDPAAVVASALEIFWGRTFTDVSVTDLEKGTGIIRTSLYHRFKNKRGLFDAVLDHYLVILSAEINRLLTNGTAGLDDIHRFLDWLRQAHRTGSRGCLMVNAMTEFGDSDPVISERGTQYIGTLTNALHAALTRARLRGEIPSTTALEATANQLVLQILGLNLSVRIGLDIKNLEQLIEAIDEGVRTLRSAERPQAP